MEIQSPRINAFATNTVPFAHITLPCNSERLSRLFPQGSLHIKEFGSDFLRFHSLWSLHSSCDFCNRDPWISKSSMHFRRLNGTSVWWSSKRWRTGQIRTRLDLPIRVNPKMLPVLVYWEVSEREWNLAYIRWPEITHVFDHYLSQPRRVSTESVTAGLCEYHSLERSRVVRRPTLLRARSNSFLFH